MRRYLGLSLPEFACKHVTNCKQMQTRSCMLKGNSDFITYGLYPVYAGYLSGFVT